MRIRRLMIAACLFAAAAASASPVLAVTHFANCTALNKVYPHGVGLPGAKDHVSGSSKPVKNFHVSAPLYYANSGSDRDKDGIACEKH